MYIRKFSFELVRQFFKRNQCNYKLYQCNTVINLVFVFNVIEHTFTVYILQLINPVVAFQLTVP